MRRSRDPLLGNLLRVLVVEGRAQQVEQQLEGSPPHLGPLVSVLELRLAEKSKAADRENIQASGGGWTESSGGAAPQRPHLLSSRTPDTSHGFHDCFPQRPRQSTAGLL